MKYDFILSGNATFRCTYIYYNTYTSGLAFCSYNVSAILYFVLTVYVLYCIFFSQCICYTVFFSYNVSAILYFVLTVYLLSCILLLQCICNTVFCSHNVSAIVYFVLTMYLLYCILLFLGTSRASRRRVSLFSSRWSSSSQHLRKWLVCGTSHPSTQELPVSIVSSLQLPRFFLKM